jgi:branched-chain amino acid transport system permease protein
MPVGRAWEALREDEIACRSLGINTTTTKLTAFARSARCLEVSRARSLPPRQGFVSPESFIFIESAIILAIVVLGGMGSLVGIAVAAAVMIGGTEILRELTFLKAVFGSDFTPELYRMLLFGMAMVDGDAVEAARLRRQPRANRLPARAQGRIGRLHQGRARLMNTRLHR